MIDTSAPTLGQTNRDKIYYFPERRPWVVELLAKHMKSKTGMNTWRKWALKEWKKLEIKKLNREQALRAMDDVYSSARGQQLCYRKILSVMPESRHKEFIDAENELAKMIGDNRGVRWDKNPVVLTEVVSLLQTVLPGWKSSVDKFSKVKGITDDVSDCYDCLLIVRAMEHFAGVSRNG